MYDCSATSAEVCRHSNYFQNQVAHRWLSNIFLTHVCNAWGIELPKGIGIEQCLSFTCSVTTALNFPYKYACSFTFKGITDRQEETMEDVLEMFRDASKRKV